MSLPKQQKAAFLTGQGQQLVIKPTEVYKPNAGHILVRIEATAINPVDWKLQETALYINEFPFILGQDASGVVVALGEGVTQFQVGDKVYVS